MLRVGRLVVVLGLALGGALGLPPLTIAHALLQSSDPAAGAHLVERARRP